MHVISLIWGRATALAIYVGCVVVVPSLHQVVWWDAHTTEACEECEGFSHTTSVRTDCDQGPCSHAQHHHHLPSHDPHQCPTCQIVREPAVIQTVDSLLVPFEVVGVSPSPYLAWLLEGVDAPSEARAPPFDPLV